MEQRATESNACCATPQPGTRPGAQGNSRSSRGAAEGTVAAGPCQAPAVPNERPHNAPAVSLANSGPQAGQHSKATGGRARIASDPTTFATRPCQPGSSSFSALKSLSLSPAGVSSCGRAWFAEPESSLAVCALLALGATAGLREPVESELAHAVFCVDNWVAGKHWPEIHVLSNEGSGSGVWGELRALACLLHAGRLVLFQWCLLLSHGRLRASSCIVFHHPAVLSAAR